MRITPCFVACICVIFAACNAARQAPPTYYQILNITSSATAAEVKAAFRTMAFKWHPDRSRLKGATLKFQRIQEAYEKLSSPNHRAAYDMFLWRTNGFHHKDWDKNGSFSQWQTITNMLRISGYHWMWQIPLVLFALFAASVLFSAVLSICMPFLSFFNGWTFYIMVAASMWNSFSDQYKN